MHPAPGKQSVRTQFDQIFFFLNTVISTVSLSETQHDITRAVHVATNLLPFEHPGGGVGGGGWGGGRGGGAARTCLLAGSFFGGRNLWRN